MSKKTEPRGGKRVPGPGKKLGRPKAPVARVQIHPAILPETLDRLAALGYRWRANGVLLPTGAVIDRLAAMGLPGDVDE